MASMAATQNSVCSVSKATPIVGSAGFPWQPTAVARTRSARAVIRRRPPRPASPWSFPRFMASLRRLYAVGGWRMDSSWAFTASGSKTRFQSGLKSTDWASLSILRAPSE
jgi:hypothetical protein